MVRRCCVKGCKSVRNLFKFPNDPKLRHEWKRNVNRPDLNIGPSSVVCVDHFEPELIIKSDKFTTTGGKIIEIPRTIPKLVPGSCPIPVLPELRNIYAKQRQSVRRKDPDVREKEIRERELKKKREDLIAMLEADKIKSFEAFKEQLSSKDLNPFFAVLRESYIVFFKLDDVDFSSVPTAKVFFKVNDNLDVNVFIDNEIVPIGNYRNFLGNQFKCDEWSKLGNLIRCLNSSNPTNVVKKYLLYVEDITDPTNDGWMDEFDSE